MPTDWNEGSCPSIRQPPLPGRSKASRRQAATVFVARDFPTKKLSGFAAAAGIFPLLRKVVDQFVIHFDARGTSKRCFEVLQDVRGLSVHFMLDLDGTIYQTLDLKEQAWHATIANGRSIGVEIANVGAYSPSSPSPLGQWYRSEAGERTTIVFPHAQDRLALRDSSAPLCRPAR